MPFKFNQLYNSKCHLGRRAWWRRAVHIGLQVYRLYRALSGSKTGHKVGPGHFMVRPLRALPHEHRASRGREQEHGEHYNSPTFMYTNMRAG